MRKKEIMAILSLILVSGGFVVRDIHNYNTQSDAIKYECIKIDSPIEKVKKLSKECEEHKRQIYIEDQVNKLREEKRLEEERKRQEELRRQQEEQQRLQQEQASQIVNRGGDVSCDRTINIEVSYYCGCNSCTPGSGITASGKPCTENLTIAMPPEFPFGTKILIDGIVYECMDTGSYIQTVGDVVRVDIYTESHQTALKKGRYRTTGAILN